MHHAVGMGMYVESPMCTTDEQVRSGGENRVRYSDIDARYEDLSQLKSAGRDNGDIYGNKTLIEDPVERTRKACRTNVLIAGRPQKNPDHYQNNYNVNIDLIV